MPVRTRSSNGRFETSPMNPTLKIDLGDESPIAIPLRKVSLWGLIKLIVVILILSPWLFMAFRKNTLGNVSQKITNFYDDNFSCSTPVPQSECETLNTTAIPPISEKINRF